MFSVCKIPICEIALDLSNWASFYAGELPKWAGFVIY
uniref:Uncharacterized protein n=1 Tax=Rhizophora mucronata TaxID=61149 RepID=A0A2P2R0Y1_RHIMU